MDNEVEMINFLISLVDDYIRSTVNKTQTVNENAMKFPLKVANWLYCKLPKEEQQKVPDWIIVDENRFQKFLQKKNSEGQDV